MLLRKAALRALAAAFFVSMLGASCGQAVLAILPGVVNDSHNLTLRREILKYGTSRLCAEMQARSLPLKLRDDDPGTGRFFPTTCYAQPLANDHLLIQFGGYGYVWTNLSQRLTFEAGDAVEYDTDFLMDGSTMYVYFRPKSTAAATFNVKVLEHPAAAALGGRAVANDMGPKTLRDEVAKGFTVIRASNGSAEFGLGIIDKGQHPVAPYHLDDRGKIVLFNDRSEVHQNQRDYVGPIAMPKGGTLTITVAVDGAPAADVLLVPKYVGETWLQQYTTQLPLTPPPGVALLDEAVYSGAVLRKNISLQSGSYYLVLDNTSAAGRTNPTAYAGDDRAAMMSYAVQLQE